MSVSLMGRKPAGLALSEAGTWPAGMLIPVRLFWTPQQILPEMGTARVSW